MVVELSINGYPEWVSKEMEKKLFPIFDIPKIKDEEIWTEARVSVELPHIGNIYTNLVFHRLKDAIEDRYKLGRKIDFSVNDIASRLYVDTSTVSTADEFMEELEELILEEREELIED